VSTLVTVWPQLGTTVTLEDGVTVIDEDGAVAVYTQEIRDLLRAGQLLDYDPRLEPTTSPDEGPPGHAPEHILGGLQEIDADQLAIDIVPPGYTRTVDALAPDVRHLGAHLKGLGAAITGGGVTAFTFSHPAFSVVSPASRRLWTGYSTAVWAAGDGWKPRYVIPDAGTLISLTTQHGAHEPGAEGTDIIYTVWRSTNGGATWAATTLTRTTTASLATFHHAAGSVAVNRGDLIGVEAVATASAASTDRLNATVLYRRSA